MWHNLHMWWNPVQSLQKHCSCCKTTWFGLLPVLKKSWTGRYLIYFKLFKKELMQKILSCLSHDQRSVTPKHKLWLIRQRVASMWSITNDNSTNTQQHGISALFLFPHSQQDEKTSFYISLPSSKPTNFVFYLQKMESVCEIEAPHTALNSGLIWRWDDKIHNYTVTYYSWADVSLRFEPDRKIA